MIYNKIGDEIIVKIVSGPNALAKFMVKDKLTAGNGGQFDIQVNTKEVPLGQEVFRVDRLSGVYVLRSKIEKGIIVSGEEVFEKILEPGDSVEVYGVKIIFQRPPRFTLISESPIFEKLKVFFINNSRRVIILSILLLLILILPLLYTRFIHSPQRPEQAEKPVYSEERLVDLIANAHRRYATALLFYNDSLQDKRNLILAIAEWSTILLTFKDIEPKPQIYYEAKEAVKKAVLEKNARIQYFKNNAYVAYQLGAKSDLRDILKQIMLMVVDPSSEDYIWAKKKLLGLYGIPSQ